MVGSQRASENEEDKLSHFHKLQSGKKNIQKLKDVQMKDEKKQRVVTFETFE